MKLLVYSLLWTLIVTGSSNCGRKKNRDQPQIDVTESLGNLGIDTTPTPRKDDAGNELPDSYNPLGARRDLQKHSELMLLNLYPFGESSTASSIQKTSYNPSNAIVSQETFWSETLDARAAAHKVALAADTRGDALEESVIVYTENNRLWIKTIGHSESDYEKSPAYLIAEVIPSCLEAVAGDFNNNGKDEIAIGLCQSTGFKLYVVQIEPDFEIIHERVIAYKQPNLDYTIEMASGNIDYDAPQELILVLNERNISEEEGLARLIILDDALNDFRTLKTVDPIAGFDGNTYAAKTAGVATGDVTGNNIDEIIVGGLLNFRAAEDSEGAYIIGYILIAYAFDGSDFEPIGTRNFRHATDYNPITGPYVYHDVFVNTLDINGDLRKEIQVNEHIFNNFFATRNLSNPWGESRTSAWQSIDSHQILWEDSVSLVFSKNKITMMVADISYDGRDNILVYTPRPINIPADDDVTGIQVWGIPGTGHPQSGQFIRKTLFRTSNVNYENSPRPIFTPVNIDRDSIQIRFLEPLKEFVFTEPLIIATLAAPPCLSAELQNIDACTTAFGRTDSTSVEKESATTVSASIHVGFNVEDRIFTQSALEVEATVTVAATFSKSSAYTLSESITYTTGAMEDGIVFTTVPFDRYVYEIATHPEADLVGQQIVVSLPRSPITLKVDRNFYNTNVEEGAVLIDESILAHSPGQLASYPNRGQRDQLLQQFAGISTQTRSVGQGTGSVELGLGVNQEYGEGKTLEIGTELTVKVTGGGFMGGFSIGVSNSNSLSVINGTEKSYTGTVGDLNAGSFADHQYNFGMFTYYYAHPGGQLFEVLNYWVE